MGELRVGRNRRWRQRGTEQVSEDRDRKHHRCDHREDAFPVQPARHRRLGTGGGDIRPGWRHSCCRTLLSVRPPSGRAPCLRLPLQPLQIGSHLRRTLVAQVAVLLQRLVDDVFQFGRHVGFSRTGATGSGSGSPRKSSRSFPAEGQLAGGHLIEHRSKREQIRARVQILFLAPVPATCRRPCPAWHPGWSGAVHRPW